MKKILKKKSMPEPSTKSKEDSYAASPKTFNSVYIIKCPIRSQMANHIAMTIERLAYEIILYLI